MVCRSPWPFVLVACALATLSPACSPTSDEPDAGAVGEGEGEGEGEQESLPACRAECDTAADCVMDDAPPHLDEDNYECVAGACEYRGCRDEAECDAIGMSADTFTCYARASFAIPLCVTECREASDCVGQGAAGAFDEDNYECDDGACWYTGCHDDAECEISLGPGAACVGNGDGATCVQGCTVAADCVGPLATAPYDEDNFACVNGSCRHLGCQSDDECAEVADDQVCR